MKNSLLILGIMGLVAYGTTKSLDVKSTLNIPPVPPLVNKRIVVHPATNKPILTIFDPVPEKTNKVKTLNQLLAELDASGSPRLNFVATKVDIVTNAQPVLRADGSKELFPQTNKFVWNYQVYSNAIVFFTFDGLHGASTNRTLLKRYSITTNQTVTTATNNSVVKVVE